MNHHAFSSGFTSIRKKTEFIDKSSKTIDTLLVFFISKWSPTSAPPPCPLFSEHVIHTGDRCRERAGCTWPLGGGGGQMRRASFHSIKSDYWSHPLLWKILTACIPFSETKVWILNKILNTNIVTVYIDIFQVVNKVTPWIRTTPSKMRAFSATFIT